MSSRKLIDLDPRFQPIAFKLIEECEKLVGPITIIETRRTVQEHRDNVARGVSWILRSKHCDGLAIDLCPTALLTEKAWGPLSPKWKLMGQVAKKLRLRWGGMWKQRDMCHFELIGKIEDLIKV